jgi:hypothetical protein
VLNAARRAEVSLQAFPEDCPTYDEADAWVRARLAEQDFPLRVVTTLRGMSTPPTTVPAMSEGQTCYRGYVYWDQLSVMVDPYEHRPAN